MRRREAEGEYYSIDAEQVIKLLSSDRGGIKESEARKRLEKYGPNKLQKEGGRSKISLFLSQFKNFLIVVLLAATLVSFAIGEVIDASVILIIVILNAVIGSVQEYRAEKSLEALKRLSSPTAVVLRGGRERRIPVEEVVPGDVIILEAGDRVPADARVIEAVDLRVDESALTGESTAVEKSERKLHGNLTLGDRRNMVYSGTVVVYGRGKAVVVATGMRTEIGKIASLVQSTEVEETPLQKRLAIVGRQLGTLILVICAVVFLVGVVKEGWNEENVMFMFLSSVSLAVAVIPEGLPAVVTMCLSLGTQRMVKRHAIIRRLPAVETLGSCDVICSDKTGTFTKNEMSVRRLYIDGRNVEVREEGDRAILEEKGREVGLSEISGLDVLGRGVVLCNNASLEEKRGDPTELGLLSFGRIVGMKKGRLESVYRRVREVPFDSTRKRMSVVVSEGDKRVVYMKGAPEVVLELCSRTLQRGKAVRINRSEREKILEAGDGMAKKALRVLAVAYRELGERGRNKVEQKKEEIEKDLVFVGLVGMMDPPREGVKEAVRTCRTAGIDVKMITGDHAITAHAIAEEIGLPKGETITGVDLDKMSDEELEKRVDGISVFARVNPEHKLRIVEALKRRGHIVAMTGDGVNDAPALKRADIGVAMGKSGTEVAKESSSMVLTDDNFSTIVAAVEEGRGIYDNIRKFIAYLMSSNLGEVLAIFLGIILFPIKLTILLPVQILWVNLITDGIPALALGVEPKEAGIMKRPPRSAREKIFSGSMLRIMILGGVIMGIGTLAAYYFYNPGFENNGQAALKAGTMAFTTLMVFEMANTFNCKSERRSLLSGGVLNNRWIILSVVLSLFLQILVIYTPLSTAFKTVPLNILDWMFILGMSLTVVVGIEILKFFERRREKTTKN